MITSHNALEQPIIDRKVLLVKKWEKFNYITELRRFLVKHPLLVLEIGFHPVVDTTQSYGFDVEKTVPCDRWFRHKQQTIDNDILQALFRSTVHDLQAEISELGDTIVIDTKHIYAWVKENNPREFITDRYDPDKQPSGDPDCRLGVKRSSNQDEETGQQAKAEVDGMAAIPLNLRGHPKPELGPGGFHNIEAGGWMRVRIDRESEAYKQLYKQRTASERINSQAKAFGIERPNVRNYDSVVNLNTLTYIVINACALQRIRNIKAQTRAP